jgi:hypothetical protein
MLTSPAAPDEAPPLHTDTLPLLPADDVPESSDIFPEELVCLSSEAKLKTLFSLVQAARLTTLAVPENDTIPCKASAVNSVLLAKEDTLPLPSIDTNPDPSKPVPDW